MLLCFQWPTKLTLANRTILFLFYFNRAFGTVISFFVRTYTWYYYKVYVDIQALQVSLLGGRVFFKGFRYHGRNETILITDGYVTWKYWLRRVREPTALGCLPNSREEKSALETGASRNDGIEAGLERRAKEAPCRIAIKLRGLEWFVYNRSPAYDAIENAIIAKTQHTEKEDTTASTNGRDATTSSSSTARSPIKEKNISEARPASTTTGQNQDTVDMDTGLPLFINLLPLQIECNKGALTMGNANSPCVLVARFKSGKGQIDARESGPKDLYRQSFDFELQDNLVEIKPNEEFKETQLATGVRFASSNDRRKSGEHRPSRRQRLRQSQKEFLHDIYRLVPFLQRSVESFNGYHQNKMKSDNARTGRETEAGQKWLGLSRYLDDSSDDCIEQERWKAIEYARVDTILDCTSLSLNFFWDIPGPVLGEANAGRTIGVQYLQAVSHADDDPQWGLDIRVGRGTLNYSPWADRQRAELQSIFFPPTYMNGGLPSPLKHGQPRINTKFKVSIILNEQVVMRILTREESKDWKWKEQLSKATDAEQPTPKRRFAHGKKASKQDANIRPAGWLELILSADSSISYSMDMVAREAGFQNGLTLDIKSPSMTSSVNHDIFLRSPSLGMTCDLSNPLEWNAPRSWTFDIESKGLDMFLLRDHVFLLTDLVNDWTSGPSPDFLTFVPFRYLISLRFDDLGLFFNVNEFNIINRPTSLEDNSFLILRAGSLITQVAIPSLDYKPLKNKVSFEVLARAILLDLNTPDWNTQSTFLEGKEVASLDTLRMSGYYDYFASTSPSLTDTLVLEVCGEQPIFHLYGVLVRSLLILEANYLGKDVHFQTLEEYQQVPSSSQDTERKGHERHYRVTNDLDVILSVEVDQGCLRLPALFYSCKEHVSLDISRLLLDLRFTSYYMDLVVHCNPTCFSSGELKGLGTRDEATLSNPELYLEGLSFSGHRLFGLPPTEPTYVCNWDFDVGSLSGQCTIGFLSRIVVALKAFAFGFADAENAWQRHDLSIVHDVTFLRVKLKPVTLWVSVDNFAFHLSSDSVKADFNDWAGARFSERASLLVPTLTWACIRTDAVSQSPKDMKRDVDSCAFARTTLDLRFVETKVNFDFERKLQQDHIALHDSRTHRTPWLLHRTMDSQALPAHDPKSKVRPPASPFPPMPELIRDRNSNLKANRSHFSSSFLSIPDSLTSTSRNRDTSHSLSSASPQVDTGKKAGGLSRVARPHFSPSSSTFSDETTLKLSSMKTCNPPQFPLMSIRPRCRHLPRFEDISFSPSEASEDSYDEFAREIDPTAKNTTILISLGPGIQTFFTSEALLAINRALSESQPFSLDSVLDDLHQTSLGPIVAASKTTASRNTQLRLDVPCATLAFHNQVPGQGKRAAKHQSIDLKLHELALKARMCSSESNIAPAIIRESIVSQGVVKTLALGISESYDVGLNKVAKFEMRIEDALAWLVKDAKSVGQIQLHRVSMTSSYEEVVNFADLISDTASLFDRLIREFYGTTRAGKYHLQSIVHYLATSHQAVPDPPSLTKASFVLRAASVHPRASDEWKIICRLRWISRFLAELERRALVLGMPMRRSPSIGQQAHDVSAALSSWRAWDLADLRGNLLMKHVFGGKKLNTANLTSASSTPLNVHFNVGEIDFVIAPGLHASRFYLSQLVTAVRSKSLETARAAEDSPKVHESTLQAACAKILVVLDWDLCELAQNLTSLLGQQKRSETLSRSQATANQTASQILRDIHLVLTIEEIELRLRTINLTAAAMVQNATTSVIFEENSKKDLTIVGTTNAQLLHSDIASTAGAMVTLTLQQAIINAASLRQQTKDGIRQVAQGGALCGNLELDLREDMLGLLGALDHVLADEFAYVKNLLPESKPAAPVRLAKGGQKPAKGANDRLEFLVSLLLNSYQLSATMMSSLRYTIQGQVARSTIEGNSGEKIGVRADFDLKDQRHLFQNHTETSTQLLSNFGIPPLNGRLSLDADEQFNHVGAFASIEEINMDASAVHALISTLSRREVTTFWHNVVRDAQLVNANFSLLMGQSTARHADRQTPTPKATLLYRARVASAGFRVKATAGGSSTLVLELGRIHSEINNEDLNVMQALVFPEIAMTLASLNVQLERSNAGGVQRTGDFTFALSLQSTSRLNEDGQLVRSFESTVRGFEISLFTETASMIVDVIGYLQQRFKNFSLSDEINTFRARRRRTKSHAIRLSSAEPTNEEDDVPTVLFTSMYSIEMDGVQIAWKVGDMTAISPGHEVEDLVFSIGKVDLTTKKENVAKLELKELQLQMVPTSQTSRLRSQNSALMPEIVFNVAYLSAAKEKRLAFQAVGKSVDLRLTSQFILPASDLQRSIAVATRDLRRVLADWNKSFVQDEQQNKKILGNKRLSSVLVDVDFAAAVVFLQSTKKYRSHPDILAARGHRNPYQPQQSPQSPEDIINVTALQTPGIAFKIEYKHIGDFDPALNAEIKVEASSNSLKPALVPLIQELSSSLREIVEDQQHDKPQFLESKESPTKFTEDDFLQVTDPSAILGKCGLNIGLRICKQEFGLSCQPIAKVDAIASFESIYIAVNTVQAAEQNRFFAVSALVSRLEASVKHAYSRDSTGRFLADSIALSLMNSRHVSNLKGISAILQFSPMTLYVNARQLNDFLLFREIWFPSDTKDPSVSAGNLADSHMSLSVQRYQQVASAGGFPWNANVSFQTLNLQVDLGQSIGKVSATISNLWLSSKKRSNWEQDLCVGFESISLGCVGRTSVELELQNLRLRTAIHWPESSRTVTPLVQASLGFDNIHAKAAWEYQAFFVADTSSLDIVMFNVRNDLQGQSDRLVCTVNSDGIHAFITTQSAAQAYSVYQAVQRMIQEKRAAYRSSVQEIERYYRRRSSKPREDTSLAVSRSTLSPATSSTDFSPIRLQTNVVVSLRAVNVGAYPRTFFDSTIFKVEATDASAAFSVRSDREGAIASRLSLQLGQVRVALSNVPCSIPPQSFEEMAVATIVTQSTKSRGGTILKVPRLVASMRTRQANTKATHIEYGFRSAFEGRVEVGWNINRVNYIRTMWETHSRALNQRLGRALTQSRVQITGVPRLESDPAPDAAVPGADTASRPGSADGAPAAAKEEGKKITAVVNVPQSSRYSYTALEPPVIETPQLRDMGEATPPLEWIGLHRDRLPNVTHQIVIVPLLEVAREVEDAYARILGA